LFGASETSELIFVQDHHCGLLGRALPSKRRGGGAPREKTAASASCDKDRRQNTLDERAEPRPH
jgi:hypothetical protein